MILHTIVPIGVVLGEGYSGDVRYKEVEYRGERVEIAEYDNTVVLSRLYSTDPRKYLDPEFEIGKNIKNNEIM